MFHVHIGSRRRSVRAIRHRRAAIALGVLTAFLPISWLMFRPDRVVRMGTAYIAHGLCSAVFVSHLDPEEAYAENFSANVGRRVVNLGLRHTIDRQARDVRVSLAGAFASRAVFLGEPGCLVMPEGESVDAGAALRSAAGQDIPSVPLENPEPGPVEPVNAKLKLAIDRAFADNDRPPYRWTKAVVIALDGRIIGERYAAGYGIDTAIHGFSATKPVVNALVGILV